MAATNLALSSSDLALLTAMLSPDLLGQSSGLHYDGANLTAPDGALSTAIAAVVADPNWKVSGAKTQLKAYAASARFNKEVGGTTVGGVGYPTDLETQAKLTSAYALSQVNPSISFDWKLPNGSFTTLNAAQLTAIATAVGTFVQQCFATEAAVNVGITANPPSITSQAQIDAAFAAF